MRPAIDPRRFPTAALHAPFAVLPSPVKIRLLRRMGHRIGEGCYIGRSIVAAERITLGDHCYIGDLNLVWRLRSLEMESGSRISVLNWITGGRTGAFRLGRNSSIGRAHFFEASADVAIGANSIVAGQASQFYSHGITPENLDDRRAIRIGDWCYVGSAARVLPGAGVGDHTFVAMGSVVTRRFDQDHVLLGGTPAKVIKPLPDDAPFFDRPFQPHAHHPPGYRG